MIKLISIVQNLFWLRGSPLIYQVWTIMYRYPRTIRNGAGDGFIALEMVPDVLLTANVGYHTWYVYAG